MLNKTILYTPGWVVCFYFACSLSLPHAAASLVPGLDLPTLIDQADSIMASRVVRTQKLHSATVAIQGGQADADVREAQIDVERILKGRAQPPARTFRFLQPLAPIGYGEVNEGDFGVFFLRIAATGYEILDPKHPSVVAAPGARVGNTDLLDQVIREVAHVLDSREQQAADRWAHLEAVQVLETVHTASANAGLRIAVGDKDPLPRTWAIAALAERGELAALFV